MDVRAPALYLVFDRDQFASDDAWLAAIAEAPVRPGVAVQVRDKGPGRDARRGLALAVASRAFLNGTTAEAAGFAGVHWPEADIPDPALADAMARRATPPRETELRRLARVDEAGRRVITAPDAGLPDLTPVAGSVAGRAASVHDEAAVLRAEAAGADFVVFAPVFDPRSKPGRGAGIDALRRVVAAAHVPVLALGGVTPDRVAACLDAGAAGVATVTGACHARDYLTALARHGVPI